MTDRGLVCGAGSVLAHMVGKSLAADVDGDRVVALLSVVASKPLPASDVMHHVEAASAHWHRGDKALANLRLVFARLPRPSDAAAVERLALSEQLLDDGLAPGDLMKALWPQRCGNTLHRYNPAQPRVPAGHGVESGRWEFAGGGIDAGDAEHHLIVAVNTTGKKPSAEEQLLFEERELLGQATPEEEIAHGRPILPSGGMLPTAPPEALKIDVLLSRFGEAAEHMSDAQEAGKPDVLTISRGSSDANRTAATGKFPKVEGKNLDEYPPAMFLEGGAGASVRAIDPRQNKALGAYIGNLCRPLSDGSKVQLRVKK